MRSVLIFACITLWVGLAAAQQTTIGTPFHTTNNSFFENIGGGFGFTIRGTPGAFPPADRARGVIGINPAGQLQPNIGFNFNNPAGLPVGGGGGAAGGGAGGGFGILGPGGSAFFNFNASQGASSFIGSQTPMVTTMNGATGTFSDTTQRPFVIGFVPVVGAGGPQDPSGIFNSSAAAPTYGTPLQEKLDRLRQGDSGRPRVGAPAASSGGSMAVAPPVNLAGDANVARLQSAQSSSAGQAADSLRSIANQQAAADTARERELADLIDQAQAAEASGKLKVARVLYEQAARRATGQQQLELQAKARDLGGK